MGGQQGEERDETGMDISLKDLSRKLEEFAKARDWEKYHSPRNLLLAMVHPTLSNHETSLVFTNTHHYQLFI